MVTGTVLSAMEFFDLLYARYNFTSLAFIKYYDCSQSFSVLDELICIHGGIVVAHHIDVHDDILYLAP